MEFIKGEKQVHRMWGEVTHEPLAAREMQALAAQLSQEKLPPMNPSHKQTVLEAMLEAAQSKVARDREKSPTVDAVMVDRSFRKALDQGSTKVGTWRLIEAIRPQLHHLSWSFWVISFALLGMGTWIFPLIETWGPAALVATVPLIGLTGLVYTLRSSNHGMREWEHSCPVTPFQLAIARLVVVLGFTLGLSTAGTLMLAWKGLTAFPVALTVSWLAPLTLISGLYLVADVWLGGLSGSAAAAVGWLGHMLLTEGGRAGTSMAVSQGEFAWSRLDGLSLLLGVSLMIVGLLMTSLRSRQLTHERSAP